ncbi:uncharacterized protein LOC102713042 isoform X3 [Oryza brachyantha]|uniref:uncharacterized protein LOC102713042 isoform X3 n=1 Tax=Oryza brachyantha TaxID=4533 RepID=UPI00077687E0|nr:uncharacterized protein LOC102713042 isoform X3 [Oryza brachyantha]
MLYIQICKSYQTNQDQPKNCGCICEMNWTFYSMSTRMSSVMGYYFLTKLCIINIVLLAHIFFLYSELIICRIIYNSLKTLFAASCWQENLTSLEAISSNSAHRNYDTARRVDALHSDLQKFKIMKQVVDIVLIAFLVVELVLAGLCEQGYRSNLEQILEAACCDLNKISACLEPCATTGYKQKHMLRSWHVFQISIFRLLGYII